MFSLCSGWVLWSRAVYEPVCSHCVQGGYCGLGLCMSLCVLTTGGYCGLRLCISLCVLTVYGWVLWSRAVYEPVCSHCVQGGYCGLGLCISLCVLTVFRVGTVVSG